MENGMKSHEFRELVNGLRDVAVQFSSADSLRDRLVEELNRFGVTPVAQPAPSEQDESVRKAWARFSNELHRSPDAPYPGMSQAFEQHFSQSFADREWRAEAATWAAAWKAAKRHCAQPAPSVPDHKTIRDLLNESGLCAYDREVDLAFMVAATKFAALAAAPKQEE